MFKKRVFLSALLATLGVFGQAHASVVYNSWTTNEGLTGNYILTVTDVGSTFNWNLTINPWNAEALGLFVDLGTAVIGAPATVSLTNVNPSGEISVFATDTSSDSCGTGCNLNGLALPALVGGDWELVFRLGDAGYEGIQTFSWTTPDFGLTESAFGLVGVRAQQLCDVGSTLPSSTSCGGSDKSYGQPGGGGGGGGGSNEIPEPATLALVGLGLLGAAALRRRKS